MQVFFFLYIIYGTSSFYELRLTWVPISLLILVFKSYVNLFIPARSITCCGILNTCGVEPVIQDLIVRYLSFKPETLLQLVLTAVVINLC